MVWLKIRADREGSVQNIKVVYSSHPHLKIENIAINRLRRAAFASRHDSNGNRKTWLYHEVVFDRAKYQMVLRDMIVKERSIRSQLDADSLRGLTVSSLSAIDSALRDTLEEYCTYDSVNREYVPVDLSPEMLKQQPPIYPREAKAQGQTGTVWIKVYVDESGGVKRASVTQSSGHPLLDKSALDVAPKNKFNPATLDGKRVPSWFTYSIDYSLE